MPSKWNKQCEGAWRMDVDFTMGDEEDDIDGWKMRIVMLAMMTEA